MVDTVVRYHLVDDLEFALVEGLQWDSSSYGLVLFRHTSLLVVLMRPFTLRPFGRVCGLAHQRAQLQGRERSASAVTAARLAPFLRSSFSRRWARSMGLSTSITQSRTSSQTSWITAMLVPECRSTSSRTPP